MIISQFIESAELTGKCENDNLIVRLPLDEGITLLRFNAGSCNEDNTDLTQILNWSDGTAIITLPIESCGMNKDKYGTSLGAGGSGTDKTDSNSDLGLFRPEADLTFGEVIRGIEVIFRSLTIVDQICPF